MIYVTLFHKNGDEEVRTDVAAVVRDGSGLLRLCFDGKPDEHMPPGVMVVATPEFS